MFEIIVHSEEMRDLLVSWAESQGWECKWQETEGAYTVWIINPEYMAALAAVANG